MTRPLLAGAAALLCLAACAAPVPDVRTAPQGGATALSYYGDVGFAVRSFAQSPQGRSLEVSGVGCRAEAGDYAASFVTPARVFVPDRGPASEPVRVTCSGGGRAGSAVAQPRAGRGGLQGAAVFPSIGVGISSDGGVGVGLGASAAPIGGPLRTVYDDVRVEMR